MEHPRGTSSASSGFSRRRTRNGAHPRPDLGADVINNSWLCSASEGCTDPEILKAVVENVRAAGVAVVVAASNYETFACGNIVEPPAIYDASFTIGATDNDDQMTTRVLQLRPGDHRRFQPPQARPLRARVELLGTAARRRRPTGIELLWDFRRGAARGGRHSASVVRRFRACGRCRRNRAHTRGGGGSVAIPGFQSSAQGR